MKKFLFSKVSAYVLAFVLSFFIVACLKEQSTTVPSSAKIDLVEFAKLHYPNIKFLPTKATARSVECVPEPEPTLECETKDVEMKVQIPPVEFLPACEVTVNFTVTICKNINNGEIYLDYYNFEYKTCQDVLARLKSNQLLSYADFQILEERYAYLVSINAEYSYSSMIAEANPDGKVIEANFYTDLCYRASIVEIGEHLFAQARDICGTACCQRIRTYVIGSGGVPPQATNLRYNKIGECEVNETGEGLGSCERSCGPNQ